MSQKAIVARAMSEVLKIIGGLGIVNVFALAMISSSSVSHRQDIAPHGGYEPFDHFEIINNITALSNPNVEVIFCGVALFFMFLRFVYGSMILMQGDYESEESGFEQVQWTDVLSIASLTLVFPILSFYGGVGDVATFSRVLIVALFIDAVSMIFGRKEGGVESLYTKYRKRWTVINGLTVLLAVPILLFLADLFSMTFIGLYIVASTVDLVLNKNFYLGRDKGGRVEPAPPAEPV